MSDVLQFECGACRTQLTVPSHMAGISGPCPTCGQTVTSPSAPPPAPAAPVFGFGMPAPAPQWTPPPAEAPPPAMMPPMGGFQPPASMPPQPPAGIPGFGQTMLGGYAGGDPSMPGASPSGTSLPPRRAPGQVPLTSTPPSGQPAWSPPGGGLGLGLPPNDPGTPMPGPPPVGNPPTQAQSRLIPGAPMIPAMPASAAGMTNSLSAGSLLGRDVPAAPVTPSTMALPAHGGFPASAFGSQAGSPMLPPTPAAPASPLPGGRNLAALRPNRGANFIRLGLAAVFLLGFLGIAGFLLKDTISAYLSPTADVPAEVTPSIPSNTPPAKIDAPAPGTPTQVEKPLLAKTTPEPSINAPQTEKPSTEAGDSGKPLMGTVSDLEDGTIPKAEPATPAEIAMVKTAGSSEAPPPATAVTGDRLLEVPAATSTSKTPAIPEAAPGAPTPRGTMTGSLDDKPSEKIPAEAEPALKTLKAFLDAGSAEERSTHVLGADLMKPLLDRYYSRNNDGPITVDHITFGRFDKQPELGAGAHCIFHIESKTWEYPVPAMLEEQADGWKVDWLTFIELKDRKLEEFFKTYQEGKAAFHVGIFRQHYFGDEVPNRDQKDAFSIGLPRPNPFRSPVFLSKDAELARQLRDRLPWEVHVWAIVELEWKKLGSQQWVELVSMPQMHWYSVPAAPRPISTSEKLPAEAPTGGEALPPGIKRSPAGSSPTIQKATAVPDQEFPPGIKRSPATRGR